MNFYEPILAAMLFLQPAGKSIYSQVVVSEDTPRPCDNDYHLLCRPPRYSEHHQGWVVAESYEQGLQRYADIARVADKVLARSRWTTPRPTLYRLLLAGVYHESGFRRDIHSGVGPAARGDCKWRKVKKGSKEVKERIPGSCRSVCLIQRLLPRGQKTAEGWTRDDLMGTDDASTERCLTLGVRILDNGYAWCSRRGPRPLVACVFQQYAGGRLHMSDRRIQARVATYHKLLSAPTQLGQEVRATLDRLSPTASAPAEPKQEDRFALRIKP